MPAKAITRLTIMPISRLKKEILGISLLIITASIIFLLTTVNPNRYNSQCTTYFEYRNNSRNSALPITATLVLRKNATGFLEMSGFFYLDGERLTVSRNINFNYSKENAVLYKISNIKSEKTKTDNVDDDFISTFFFSSGTGRERFMSVLKERNTLIIGNVHSPVFICVL